MIGDQQLSQEVDAMAERLASVKRRRSPVEAAPALTRSYVDLLFAIGHARLGNRERATEMVEYPQAELGAIGDRVHGWLFAAMLARVVQTHAHAPRECGLPKKLVDQYSALDRIERYKVDRFREASQTLEPLRGVDAIATMSRNVEVMYGESSPSKLVLARVESADAIEANVASLEAIPAEQRGFALAECLCAATAYRESEAMPVVVRAVGLIDGIMSSRLVLWATALRVIAHFGWGELVESIQTRLCRELRDADFDADVGIALSAAMRALRYLGLHQELSEVVSLGNAIVTAAPDAATSLLRFALAGAASVLGNADAAEFLAAAERPSAVTPVDIDRLRRLAVAYAHMEPAIALDKLRQLESQFPNVTDSFGTNTHFAVSVIRFVDALVDAITTLSITRG